MASTAKYDQLIQDLRAEYRPQREWSENRGLFLVSGHFLVGVAAGGWLFGLLLERVDILIASFCLAGLGGISHLFFLGRPSRVLNMMRRPNSSWISRGFLGLSCFLGGGFLYLVPNVLPNVAWGAESLVADVGYGLAIVGMVVLIVYMGFVYSSSKAIPFWNSPLHPLMYIGYAGRGGVALALLTLAVQGEVLDTGFPLLELWMAITAVVVVLWLLDIRGAATGSESAARQSVHELLAGRVALYFYGGTLLIGLVVPAFLIGKGDAALSVVTLAAIGVFSVVGDFFIKFSTIKAGVYRPIRLNRAGPDE